MICKYTYGEKVKDDITKCIGTVTAVTYYYDYRPTQYLIEFQDASGRPVHQWVDENRIRIHLKGD